MSKPVAVLISDVHYNLQNLALADEAMRQAISKAADLDLPLIVAGDLHDTKAMLRGECVTAMLRTMHSAKYKPFVIVGNHDLLNEKSKDHSLEFLRKACNIVEDSAGWEVTSNGVTLHMIPYYSNLEELKHRLDQIPIGSTIIMHQGIDAAWKGHYVHDKTAAPAEWFSDYRVISGHYHRRQDIKTGRPRKGAVGLFSYLGTPYTTSFAEAEDGPKGFNILMDDGLLEFVPTNLREHRIIEMKASDPANTAYQWGIPHDDLVWVKMRGTREELARVDKKKLGHALGTGDNFKLDLIPVDEVKSQDAKNEEKLTNNEILDKLIDGLPDGKEYKDYIKSLTQEILQ